MMNLFIGKVLKKKELCNKLNDEFNKNKIFDTLGGLMNYLLENLNDGFDDLLTLLFEFCTNIQTITQTRLEIFSNEFFRKLIQKIDKKNDKVSQKLNDKLYSYFCDLLTSDIFATPDSYPILENSLTYLIDSVLNNEHKSIDIFSIIHKIMKIYQMKDVGLKEKKVL